MVLALPHIVRVSAVVQTPRRTCSAPAFPVVSAALRPARQYRISSGAAAELKSTEFFGAQPLTTREAGELNVFEFTTRSIPPRFALPANFVPEFRDEPTVRFAVERAVRCLSLRSTPRLHIAPY